MKKSQPLTEASLRKIVGEEIEIFRRTGLKEEFAIFRKQIDEDVVSRLDHIVKELETMRQERTFAVQKDRDQDKRLDRLEVQVFGGVKG